MDKQQSDKVFKVSNTLAFIRSSQINSDTSAPKTVESEPKDLKNK